MRLPPEGARWLVTLRWLACVVVIATTWLCSSVLRIIVDPTPVYAMYGVGLLMAAYNLALWLGQRRWKAGERDVDRNVFLQITLDLVALTLLLYFSDLAHNPFLFFFVFPMIIASMYLHGRVPYYVAAIATGLVGAEMLLEYSGAIPSFPIQFPSDPLGSWRPNGLYRLSVFTALTSTLWITVYFTTSLHHYADRAHAELRQKEKMVGIGQLVAGIAHQIANPLDGVQNCLQRIGEGVKDDAHLTEYVQLMTEALERIERTAKRVQAFARPRGVTLQRTDVNQAVEGTLQVLGTNHGPHIQIETQFGDVAPVHGDPYTLQEVLFNLCTNALAAMPDGGALTLRTYMLGRQDKDRTDLVAVDVTDTGVGIPRVLLEKIFEPFYTTRAESGGTGMGLGLCRMLIAEMGGRIDVRSTVGQGSTFTVVLYPAAPETPAGEA